MADRGVNLADRVDAVLCRIFVHEYERMVRLARRLLACRGVPESAVAAEDLVQTAFASVLEQADRDTIRDPRAYLYKVLRNQVRAAVQREFRRREAETASTGDRADAAPVLDVGRQVSDRVVLGGALARLSPQQREAVYRTHALGYTQRETALAMGNRPGTVATHVARGLVALRVAMVVVFVVVVGSMAALARWAHVRLADPASSPWSRLPDLLDGSRLWGLILSLAGFAVTKGGFWVAQQLLYLDSRSAILEEWRAATAVHSEPLASSPYLASFTNPISGPFRLRTGGPGGVEERERTRL
ncbi:RNA polymerase sigma factor [Streptomyces sp. NPDC050211]|uniref:RNA polymerase sigma factor n=1 Tax=Streptomyces sp. NPDC050211 TaxID=3154932 RepID=UPI00341FA8B3